MTNLLEFYRMKTDTNTDSIVFEKVKKEDIRICGYSLTEVIDILNALDFERITEIKFCRANISKYVELYNEEQKKIQRAVLDNILKNNLYEENEND